MVTELTDLENWVAHIEFYHIKFNMTRILFNVYEFRFSVYYRQFSRNPLFLYLRKHSTWKHRVNIDDARGVSSVNRIIIPYLDCS